MKQFLLTLVSMWSIALLSAQPLLIPVGKNTATGSYSRHFQQVISAWANPAGLSCLSSFAAGVYTENRFLLKGTSLYAAMVAVPVGSGAFGGSVTRLGNTAWHQQKVSGAYGRQLGRKVGIGIQFSSETTATPGFGSNNTVSADGGLLWHISRQLHTGLHLYKSAGMPVIYSGGAGFEASRDFLLTGEIRKAGDITTVKAAAYYRIVRAMALEMGIASAPFYNNAAVIFFLHALRIDLAVGFHPQLGITPATSLIWQLSNRQEVE
ncbi:hypothetical protein [Chitinophaga arvensicola]|uniref:Type IX secretion system membrane protein, PorP/SprF family n=1 Tax=Chitinophaga arvensicola TaxID=29529 RepID=A0A1I0SCX2_9BACT|nr:hypothetical protein [Chitinophaga arvensicola]SEW55388.1 hypothetical protein SAMN04488122_6376 [Chitinophaga arvensicola]